MRLRMGFTLIELLVVVTIIVVLLALLTPALDLAMSEAERAVCAAKLRGGALALRLYANDNKGYLPPPTGQAPGGAPPQDGNHWWYREWIHAYGGRKPNLYICPSDVGWPGGSVSPNRPLYSNPNWGVSYYLNIQVTGNNPSIANTKITTLSQPHKAVLLCDWPAYVSFSWHRPRFEETGRSMYYKAMNNYSFVDGHAALVETYWRGVEAGYGTAWSFAYNPPSNFEYTWDPRQ